MQLMDIKDQRQSLSETIQYEFDLANTLASGDMINSCVWTVPDMLEVVSSNVTGTVVKALIKSSATAKAYDTGVVTFLYTSANGEKIELGFEVSLVNYRKVKVI